MDSKLRLRNGLCKSSGGGTSNIPCSACVVQDSAGVSRLACEWFRGSSSSKSKLLDVFQDKCQAARPRAVDFGPKRLGKKSHSASLFATSCKSSWEDSRVI